MGLKPRLQINEKPVVVPKAPPPPRLASVAGTTERAKLPFKAAFGLPFTVVPARGYKGPKIPGFDFIAAWRVEQSDELILDFLDVSERIGNVQKLFHGTPATNMEAICTKGLRPGRSGCMFGSGIYMGGPLKAIGYVGWGTSAYMFEVEAALGKVKPCMAAERHNKERLVSEGYDSVGGFANQTASWGGTLRHNEYVVYSPDQVIVNYILEYRRNGESTYSPYYTPPPPTTQGACNVLKEKDVPLDPKNRAFKDIISRQACGNVSYTNVKVVRVDNGHHITGGVWVCKPCADALKLRIGSKLDIKTANYRESKATVRIVQ